MDTPGFWEAWSHSAAITNMLPGVTSKVCRNFFCWFALRATAHNACILSDVLHHLHKKSPRRWGSDLHGLNGHQPGGASLGRLNFLYSHRIRRLPAPERVSHENRLLRLAPNARSQVDSMSRTWFATSLLTNAIEIGDA